jgi:RNA polymerase sigma-70 factor (ECF subfamily)
MEAISDERLLEDLKRDDKQAFKQLTERYLDKVWRLSYRMLQNKQDAEDVAQEVFVSVWNNRHRWESEGAKFSTWIYRVAVNRSIDLSRKRKGGQVELTEEIAEAPGISAEDAASRHQMQGLLLECLKQLPEKQMLALLYFYYEEMDIPEICNKLQATEDAVRSLLKRGRANMKDIIRDTLGDDHCDFEGAAPYLRG